MLRFFILFTLTFFSMATLSAQTKYSKVKINLTQTPVSAVAALGLEADHGAYAPGRHLINDYSEQEIEKLIIHNIPHEILIEDVVAWYQQRNLEGLPAVARDESCGGVPSKPPGAQYSTPANYQLGSMGGYPTYLEMLTALDQMQELYPDLITTRETIESFTTHLNRPIYWLAISDNPNADEGEPEIMYTALHHAREANSLSQLIFYMWYLLENYETDDQIKFLVDNTKMYFIPCVNPDGYIYNQIIEPNGGGQWRKNRRDNNDNTFGVDLNRNYGYLWGDDDVGSSPNTNSDTYRGPGPFSEPETQAVAAFLADKNIEITLNCHSFSNLLIRPEASNTEDSLTYENFGKILTAENAYIFGTDIETVGYSVNGDSDSWMYTEEMSKPKIFSMTPEVGPQIYGFWPPSTAIIDLNKAVMSQNIIAANLLYSYLEVEDNSPSILTNISGNFDFLAKEYGLRSGLQTITILPLTENLAIDADPVSLTLSNSTSENFSIPYTITPNGNGNEPVSFAVTIDNGSFIRRDTINKQYINGIPQELANEDNSSFENYSTDGTWAITSSEFISSPSSITDSPMGTYENQTDSEIFLNTPIDLTSSDQAILSYWAKWQIEDEYDYVQIMASTDNGVSWTSLCGKYTNLAVRDQPEGEQLYDGNQSTWILEEIDLSEFTGETVLIKFSLFTDQFVQADGFYFDDLMVTSYNITTSTEEIFGELTDFKILPNPFSTSFSVELSMTNTKSGVEISLLNAMGQLLQSKNYGILLAGRHRFDWDGIQLRAGVYFMHYQDDDGEQKILRIVK